MYSHNATTYEHTEPTQDKPRRRIGDRKRRWLEFAICLLIVWAFMFIIAPALQSLPPIRSIAGCIEETGINASALYYTGVEETAEVEMYLHNATEYGPEKR